MIVPLASACHYRPTPRDLIPIVRMDKAPPVSSGLLRSHSQIVLTVAVYIGDPPIRKGFPQKAREAFFHQVQLGQLVPDLLFGPLALIDIPIDAHPAISALDPLLRFERRGSVRLVRYSKYRAKPNSRYHGNKLKQVPM